MIIIWKIRILFLISLIFSFKIFLIRRYLGTFTREISTYSSTFLTISKN